jgi:DnaJ-class molecular chaperone
MAKPKDYYELLGVEKSATAEEIRSAYRKLARKLHPDVNKAPDAAKRFAEVQEAYDVLSDAEKRKAYDRFGHAGVGAGPRGPAGGTGPGAGPFEGGFYTQTPGGGWTHYEGGGFGDEDVEGIFEQMFGGRTSGGGAGFGGRGGGFGRGGSPFGGARTRARTQPQRGADLEHAITIAFMTAVLGGSEQLRIGSTSSGDSGESQTITVKIPPGIDSGAKLRVRGKGQPGHNGGPTGDIILTVQVGQHPYFRREGLDVLIDVPINIAEAVTGTSVQVPLLQGTVQIKVPPGVSSGRRLRVKGKGIVDHKGKAGDFYAVIQIAAPAGDTLSEKGRRAVNELASELQNPRESAPWADDVKDRSA